MMEEAAAERYALRMVNIEKYFGLVCALKNINLDVGRNEDHRAHRRQRRR